MKKIKRIIIHCSATIEGANFDREDIDRWHKKRGWREIGYHYVITIDGKIQTGRALNQIGAGAKGYNRGSVHICYIGGLDGQRRAKDTRTDAQKKSLLDVISWLKLEHPEAEVLGHRDLPDVAKACPCFNAVEEYKNL